MWGSKGQVRLFTMQGLCTCPDVPVRGGKRHEQVVQAAKKVFVFHSLNLKLCPFSPNSVNLLRFSNPQHKH